MFRFIEETSFVSDMDMAGLAFFDECTERIDEENGNIFSFLFFLWISSYESWKRNNFQINFLNGCL